jgi:hypothetical protein
MALQKIPGIDECFGRTHDQAPSMKGHAVVIIDDTTFDRFRPSGCLQPTAHEQSVGLIDWMLESVSGVTVLFIQLGKYRQ